MKKVLLVFTMLLALVASAGWFGIITQSDVKDAFIRATWYHEVFVEEFEPSSVSVEKTETDKVWRISWFNWKLNPFNNKRTAEKKHCSGLFYAEKGKKYSCVLTKL